MKPCERNFFETACPNVLILDRAVWHHMQTTTNLRHFVKIIRIDYLDFDHIVIIVVQLHNYIHHSDISPRRCNLFFYCLLM